MKLSKECKATIASSYLEKVRNLRRAETPRTVFIQIGDALEKLHNLQAHICSFENLMGAYRDASACKRYRNEVIEFSLNLGENLLDIKNELENMTYTVGPYREFYVRYPKPRLVMALGFRDRIVQWAIYRVINPYLDKKYITHSYGCRCEKGTLAAAKCLHSWQQLISRKKDAEDWYIIKGDISKYFYRVDHQKIVDTYATTSNEEWFAWIIDTIINNPDVPFGLPPGVKPDDCPREKRLFDVGMPIGNLTSQETANLFLDKMDKYFKHILHMHFYVRYMDDFCVLVRGKENANTIYNLATSFLKNELYLDISPKSRIQKATAPVEFVGYIVTPHGIRMRKKTTKHIKKSLKHIMDAYRNGDMEYDEAMESVTCYLGMCKNCNGYNMRCWIIENFVLQRSEGYMKKQIELQKKRNFYQIHENDDGTADIYLRPEILPANLNELIVDYDVIVLVVKGVEMYDTLEDDIRARYDDWCESADIVYL
mgnify:CR=1 FL=1